MQPTFHSRMSTRGDIMSFNEKLQKLRKQNGLSQEGLADLLDVTRQSVSKWESGTTYPEMDKLLSMCKIFKCSLEDLTNDDITDIKIEDKKKSNIYTFIDSILEFMKETYNLLKSMNKQEIENCIVTMGITCIILLLFRVPVIHINNIFHQLIISTSNHFWKACCYIINLILNCSYWSLFLVIFIYIFKTNYLNNEKYKNRRVKEMPIQEEKTVQEKQEEVLVREPIVVTKKVTNRIDTLFRILEKSVMFFLKAFVCFMILPILFLLFILCASLFIAVYLIFKGVFYISILIGIPFAILLILTILEILMCFIVNRRTSEKRLTITFLTSIIGLGSAFGLFLLDLSSIHFIDTAPEIEQNIVQLDFEMTDDLYFLYSQMAEYKIDDTLGSTVKVEAEYYEDYAEVFLNENSSSPYYNKSSTFQLIPIMIQDLSKRKLYNYSKLEEVQIRIYTSEENIEILKQNYEHVMNDMYAREEQYHENNNYYINRINALEIEKNGLEEEQWELKQQISELESVIEEFKNKMNQLQEIITE